MKIAHRKDPNNNEKIIDFARECFRLKKFDEAQVLFSKILKSESKFNSFEELNQEILKFAKINTASNLSYNLRLALLYIGLIHHEHGNDKIANDYLLDAAYKCKDPRILMVTGKYYLEIYDAEVNTALGYFKLACDLDKSFFSKCNALWKDFLDRKLVMYPYGSLDFYIKKWEELSRLYQ